MFCIFLSAITTKKQFDYLIYHVQHVMLDSGTILPIRYSAFLILGYLDHLKCGEAV